MTCICGCEHDTITQCTNGTFLFLSDSGVQSQLHTTHGKLYMGDATGPNNKGTPRQGLFEGHQRRYMHATLHSRFDGVLSAEVHTYPWVLRASV